MPANTFAAATALVLLPVTTLTAVHHVSAAPATPSHRASVTESRPAATAGSPPRSLLAAEQWRASTPVTPYIGAPHNGGWSWPLSPRPAVVRGFSVGPYPWSPGHRGVDLATSGGASLLAPADGVVTFVRTIVDRPVLVITHAGGIRTAYEPVTATVPSGTRVARGTVVGRVAEAAGHCAPRTCMHWSARRVSRYIDPLSLLSRPSIVLLPIPTSGRARDG
jgi:murein DD-endopeptidase MepM/ murein hydrolase activator NlpD